MNVLSVHLCSVWKASHVRPKGKVFLTGRWKRVKSWTKHKLSQAEAKFTRFHLFKSFTIASWHVFDAPLYLTIPFSLLLLLLLPFLPCFLCLFLLAYSGVSLEKSGGLHPLKASYLRDVTSQFALAELFAGGMCIDFSVNSESGANSWIKALKPGLIFKYWEFGWQVCSFMCRHTLQWLRNHWEIRSCCTHGTHKSFL